MAEPALRQLSSRRVALLLPLLLLLPAPATSRYCLPPWASDSDALSATLYDPLPSSSRTCARLQQELAAAAACATRIHAPTHVNLTACLASRTRVLLLLADPGPPPPPPLAPPPRRPEALPLYRVRAVGASGVLRGRVVRCGGRLAVAALDLTAPGPHSVEVLLEDAAFSFCRLWSGGAPLPTAAPVPGAPPAEPWLGFLAVEVAAVAAAGRASADASAAAGEGAGTSRLAWSSDPPVLAAGAGQQQQPTRASGRVRGSAAQGVAGIRRALGTGDAAATRATALPACRAGGLLPGRWEFQRWPAAEADALARTCVWAPKDRQATSINCSRPAVQFDAAASLLRWRPAGCALAPTPSIRPPAACLRPGRKLCTLGDSHSRYLAYALDAWATNFTSVAAMDCRSWDKVPPVSDFAAFYHDPWAIKSYPDGFFDGCSVLVANTGHWPASFQTRGRPLGVAYYQRHLRAWAASVLAPVAARGRTRVLYALSVAAPVTWRQFLKEDWRYDAVLEMYNLKAVEVAAEMGLSVVDLWGMTTSLPEGAWDSSHFFWRGAVGAAVLNAVLNAACL